MNQGNGTTTAKIERYNTTVRNEDAHLNSFIIPRSFQSVVCWVAAFFCILSFSFAWLRSPRSGRIVLALGIFVVALTQGVVYFFWVLQQLCSDFANSLYIHMLCLQDPFNENLCRFKSLEPTPASASKCIQAYAISFAITEVVALAIFVVLGYRQELFWDAAIIGVFLNFSFSSLTFPDFLSQCSLTLGAVDCLYCAELVHCANS